jgi:competence protein ComEC
MRWSLAALVVLLLRPETLIGPSFQMSFAAVVALIAAYEATRAMRLERRAGAGAVRRVAQYVGDIAATSLIAASATAPYVIFHFNRTADYGVAANMLAVPLTGFWIMPWAVVALLLMPFGLRPRPWCRWLGIEGGSPSPAPWRHGPARAAGAGHAGRRSALVTLAGWLCLWQRPWRARARRYRRRIATIR